MYRLNTYIGLGLLLLSCSQEEEKIQPQVNDLVESVYSSVIIQPDSLYRVHASINGILEKNFVDEGDLVTEGHLLMQVTNTRPKLQSENSKIALDLAKQNIHGNSNILQSLREEISAIELTFINDSVDYFRQQRLWNQQIGSQVALDNKKLKYELSRNTLIRLQDKYQQTKNQLNTYLKQAENNYVSSVVNAEDFRIKSNIKGKVYALYKNPGEIVNVQEPLALLGSATDFNIEMLVDEKDIVKIKQGQEVILSLEAYKDEVFIGSVYKIYPNKDARNQTFKVEALFKTAPKTLYPGLAGEANIIIAKKENVMTIPKIFLIGNNQVKTKDQFTIVELGIESLDRVEILSGISPSTWIYKPE